MKMQDRLRRAVIVASALFLAAAGSVAQEPYGVVVSRDVLVPMRDGVRLAADIYRPARNGAPVEGRFPVILERTPYGKGSDGAPEMAVDFARHGYVAVAQDVRGRYGSEGTWRFTRDDVSDGYDTAKWIGAQPWCDGGIGTVGTSYPGGTQHALAISNPPYLKAMIPVDAMSDYGRYGIRHNGAFELRWLNWMFGLGFVFEDSGPVSSFPGVAPEALPELQKLSGHVRDYARGLPLRPGTTPLALAPDYEAWLVEAMRHGENDDFWKDAGDSVVDHVAEYKDVPVYHVSGWYDSWAGPVANLNYVALSKAKRNQRLIMGPWTHGGQTESFAGEAEFGAAAAIDLVAFQRRWFDRWLKGFDNGIDREPPVRIFVMGVGDGHKTPEGRVFVGGFWREEREWPLARARVTPYYVHADGTLSPEKPGVQAPTRYLFDPKHPVPTIGGNLSSQGELAAQGAKDQRCRAGDLDLRRRAAALGAKRRPGLPHAAAPEGRRSHGPPDRRALGVLLGPRHGLHSQARRRLPAE